MSARPNFARIDQLAQRLANQAFRTLISLCPEIKSLDQERQDAVCVAVRNRVAPVIESMCDDTRLAPCLAQAAFQNAVLTLALAGVEALRTMTGNPIYRSQQFRKAHHAQHVHHH